MPIPISSVPTAAVAEAAQRHATLQQAADAVAPAPRQQTAATSQPMVASAPVTTAEQFLTQHGAAPVAHLNAHGLPGFAVVPNGEARSATEPAQALNPHVGFGIAAVGGNSTFESWLDATLPTSQHDALMSGSMSQKAIVAGAELPHQTNHRWTVAGAADAGCARAAPVGLMAASQSSEHQRSQPPAASVLTPHVMPTWFVPTQ